MSIVLASKVIGAITPKLGCGYVYGHAGKIVTVDTLKAADKLWGYKGTYPSMTSGYYEVNGDYNKGRCARWMGKWATDCSGLIKWARREAGGEYADVSANGTYNQCTKRGTISTIKLIPGTLVFMYNKGKARMVHVGIYIGNGYCIEARSVQHGIVKTLLASRSWSHWGQPDWMQLDIKSEGGLSTSQTKVETDCGDASNIKSGDFGEPVIGKFTVNVTTLNVRKGPGASYEDIGDTHRNEVWNVFEAKNNWYRIGSMQWISGAYGVFSKSQLKWLKSSNCAISDDEFMSICNKIEAGGRYSDVQGIINGIYSSSHKFKDSWLRAEAK